MAKNRIFANKNRLSVACTDPATPKSGDPVLFGQRPGVALTDEDTNGNTSVQFDGVFNLSVKGTNGSNAAIAAGDILYYVAANTPKLSTTTTGVRFGYAMAAVTSGATSTIAVAIGY